MLGISLVFGIITIWAAFHFLSSKKEAPSTKAISHEVDIKCPSCKAVLQIEKMLDNAVFFGPGAIVFDCDHCHDRVYFAPYEEHIETGALGCSPVVDPIPYEEFSYPPGFDLSSSIQDGILKIQIKEQVWTIPRYGLWDERTDIPHPKPAIKKDARQ